MKDLYQEYCQRGICLNSFDCVFVHKEVRGTNKTEIKDGLHYRNKKQSIPGDIIIYTAEDLVMNRNTVHFLNHLVFLKLYLYEEAQNTEIIP